MKKILVPCDFSDSSVQAFRFAAEIAIKSHGEIFLLNVAEFPMLPFPSSDYETSLLKEIKEKASKALAAIKEKWLIKSKVHLAVEIGLVTEAINKFVLKKKIDLVVMGTHGASGFREYAFGSNAEKIVRSAHVPVITLRHMPKSGIKNIIFPIDLVMYQQKLVTLVKALQTFFGAKLHVLYVNNPAWFMRDSSTERRLNEFAKANQLKNYTLNIYNDIDPEEGIINFSAKFKNRLVAMSTHGRKGLNHLLTGSVAEDVVNHLDCPIWTFAGH